MAMGNTCRWSRPVAVVVLAIAITGCALPEFVERVPAEHRVVIASETGSERIVTVPRYEPPPGAPSCQQPGVGRGRSRQVGTQTVVIRPAEFRRPAELEVLPSPAAPAATFSFSEIPSRFPEIWASGPANRPVRVTVSAERCDYSGDLVLYHRSPRDTDWRRVEGAQVPPASVSAVIPSLQSRFALGTD